MYRSLILSLLLLAIVAGCAGKINVQPTTPPPPRPDPVQTAIAAGEHFRREQSRSTLAACVTRTLADGQDPTDPAVVQKLAACRAGQPPSEAEQVRTVSILALGECLQKHRNDGQTDAEARRICAAAAKKLPGIRVLEGSENSDRSVGESADYTSAPAMSAVPILPSRPMIIGRVGEAVPTGWNATSGFHITRTPEEWDDSKLAHVPFCNLEVAFDGMPVLWTDAANVPYTVPVPPGTGQVLFGGARVSVLPVGESGYVRFDRVIGPDGRGVVPNYPTSNVHSLRARCWRYTILPESSGGAVRPAEHAVLAFEMTSSGKVRTDPGSGELLLPARLFAPTSPLPLRPLI